MESLTFQVLWTYNRERLYPGGLNRDFRVYQRLEEVGLTSKQLWSSVVHHTILCELRVLK